MTNIDVLQPAIIYIGAGLAAAFASRAVRLSPIVGYLVAGLVIGPSGFSLVADSDATHFLAELGVVFLLFDIGLQFSLREIRTRRRDVFGLAPIQIALCALVFVLLGLALGLSPPIAVIVGVSLALSSTAVVVRILADRNQRSSPAGRSATAVLVAQDVVAVFLLVFAASLGAAPVDTSATMPGIDTAITLGLAVAALIIALLVGRYVLRPLFRSLAATDNTAAFTVVALFIVLAASAATARFGLSLTLGALLAGIAISDTPQRRVIQTDLKPFHSLLIGLFFMSVGMGVNLPAMAAIWPAVLLTALVIVVVKTIAVFLAARLNRWAVPGATQLGFLLGQGSEFTLVVVGLPGIALAAPGAWSSVIIAAVAVTLVAAPIWTALGQHIARLLAERSKANSVAAATAAADHPVLIFGMTEEGRLAADALRDANIPYIAVESDPERYVSAASDGYTVVHGDARDLHLMSTLGAARARAFVLAVPGLIAPSVHHPDNVSGAATGDWTGPDRFSVAADQTDRAHQASLGQRAHISLATPRGVELTTDLLAELGIDAASIAQWLADRASYTFNEKQETEAA